jgi:hypothetical protein
MIYFRHSVTSELKKLMAQEVMCDCELRKMWVGQSKLKKLFYSLRRYQVQFAGIVTLQFKIFAMCITCKLTD